VITLAILTGTGTPGQALYIARRADSCRKFDRSQRIEGEKMAVLPAAMTLPDATRQGDDNAFEILLQPLLEPGYRLAGG